MICNYPILLGFASHAPLKRSLRNCTDIFGSEGICLYNSQFVVLEHNSLALWDFVEIQTYKFTRLGEIFW
jgi:hypothetical protein